jgi:hypothetical protein
MASEKRSRVVYTAMFGGYDFVAPVDPTWSCDFICFTDNSDFIGSGWTIVSVELNGVPPNIANRRYKILPHAYLAEYEQSLYIDGNIRLVRDPLVLFDKYLTHGPALAALPHPKRNCVYQEAAAILEGRLLDREGNGRLRALIDRYAQLGLPAASGLTENGVLLRRHHDPFLQSIMEEWWEEFLSGPPRDQLSLPYVLWKASYGLSLLEEGPRTRADFFEIDLHRKDADVWELKRALRLANLRKHRSSAYRGLFRMKQFAIDFLGNPKSRGTERSNNEDD